MNQATPSIFIGTTPQLQSEKVVHGHYVDMLGDSFYQIQNFDAMAPFFISIVSSSNQWLFISSTGGLSAGRSHADYALFPYYTEDKITENSENTGNKAVLLLTRADRTYLWEPLSNQHTGSYEIERNLYKNVTGTALVFEEHNRTLGLTYRYAWRTSEKYGFVKTTWLVNTEESACTVEFVDGLQNLLAANINTGIQGGLSCLVDAYKRSELDASTGLGIFALNAILSDLAEPSESLLAATVAQVGLTDVDYLLSSQQLNHFRMGRTITQETEVRGRRGAYLVHGKLNLTSGESRSWHLIAEVQQDHVAVVEKLHWLHGDQAALAQAIESDIAEGQANLWKLVAKADGVQLSASQLDAAFHFANVMFNVMRGGVPAHQYWIQAADFKDFVETRNRPLAQAQADFFAALPPSLHVTELQQRAQRSGSPDLIRLSYTFLPLIFSRRHGDPSRPWNRFSINIKKADGTPKVDYEGNWRDIFQNWEALAYAYPEYAESMISTFLSATTADGYNPYRITLAGIDWEVPEPDNPWANIGYWSDHQIIYLLKLMEFSVNAHPGKLSAFLNQQTFSYAQVPYRLKPYAQILKNPYSTIEFDWDVHHRVGALTKERGTDGKLVCDKDGRVIHASLAEKLLTLLLAKLGNLVPEGGIWMNTQRPEWNDANNALVGKGLSVVTLGYLRRYLAFCLALFKQSGLASIALRTEIQRYCQQVIDILRRHEPALSGTFSDSQRRRIMDELGETGSAFRWNLYREGFAETTAEVPVVDVIALLELAERYVDHSLRANKRADHLYHAYNILALEADRASIGHLYEMLEGQVSILSSGILSAEESVALLKSLRASALYRADQDTYILYPDRPIRGFLAKNRLSTEQVKAIQLFPALVAARDKSLITRDIDGDYHFSGTLRNVHDVDRALDKLRNQPHWAALVEADAEKIRALFEANFRHSEFTGRSGTFFGYEGLGSIYWHMNAKLLLAVQETMLRFRDHSTSVALAAYYRDIRQGLGLTKSPDVYGAFPTDPYSHTPKGQGARQPGMTGMVKELILTRQAELGFLIDNGKIAFDGSLLNAGEFLSAPADFTYLDVNDQRQKLRLNAGELAYTICQTPIIVAHRNTPSITVKFADGTAQNITGGNLDDRISQHIFQRDGRVSQILIHLTARQA